VVVGVAGVGAGCGVLTGVVVLCVVCVVHLIGCVLGWWWGSSGGVLGGGDETKYRRRYKINKLRKRNKKYQKLVGRGRGLWCGVCGDHVVVCWVGGGQLACGRLVGGCARVLDWGGLYEEGGGGAGDIGRCWGGVYL